MDDHYYWPTATAAVWPWQPIDESTSIIVNRARLDRSEGRQLTFGHRSKRAAGYIRVSTEEQVKHGWNLATERERIERTMALRPRRRLPVWLLPTLRPEVVDWQAMEPINQPLPLRDVTPSTCPRS